MRVGKQQFLIFYHGFVQSDMYFNASFWF